MEFRPCIDIHNGQVKQIVGSSLSDICDFAKENFVSSQNAAFYAQMYKKLDIKGGHVILLNSIDSEHYENTKKEAVKALQAYPGGLQIGGGIMPDNAAEFIQAGASHVIVTSYVFYDGKINLGRLEKLTKTVGKEHLVLDLSCKKTEKGYLIATNRWQILTETELTCELLEKYADYCDEFLIHAVDVEGKSNGVECNLLQMLGDYLGKPVTYAGGVHCMEDIDKIKRLGNNRVNVTIGSALEIFGGTIGLEQVIEKCKNK